MEGGRAHVVPHVLRCSSSSWGLITSDADTSADMSLDLVFLY